MTSKWLTFQHHSCEQILQKKIFENPPPILEKKIPIGIGLNSLSVNQLINQFDHPISIGLILIL